MTRPPLRLRLVLVPSVLSACVAFAACSGEEPGPAAPSGPDASSETSSPDPPNPDPDPAPADAGADAEVVTEDGDLPDVDPDAGVDDGDGGVDAGAGCATLTPGVFGDSSCSSLRSIVAGGNLTSTTYLLDKVTVLGNTTFCSQTFKVYEHRGTLKVTASSPTAATFELLDQYRDKASPSKRYETVRYDVEAVASGSSLAFTPTASCPGATAPPASALYTVGSTNGKATITLRLPYGKGGTANYRFVEP